MTDVVDIPARRFIGADESFSSVGLDVSGIAFGHPLRLRWWLAFAAALGLLGVLALSIGVHPDRGSRDVGQQRPRHLGARHRLL